MNGCVAMRCATVALAFVLGQLVLVEDLTFSYAILFFLIIIIITPTTREREKKERMKGKTAESNRAVCVMPRKIRASIAAMEIPPLWSLGCVPYILRCNTLGRHGT